MHSRALPQGSGYPLYLFCFLRKTKKDAAAIPNAAAIVSKKEKRLSKPLSVSIV